MNVIILGAPGSGKGTQAARLSEEKKIQHISSGDLLREAVANKTSLGQQVESVMAEGKLVPDSIVLNLIEEKLTDHSGDEVWNGWILDGYPRTLSQAEALEDVLSSARETVEAVVVLDIDPDVVVDRLSKRKTCLKCKTVYHDDKNPPSKAGTCDACGGELIQRDDDKPETIRKRLKIFEEETLPILDLYEQRYDVYRIEGSRPIDEVADEISKLVNV